MEDLKVGELIDVVYEYIRNNYDYSYADIFGDAIVYHLEDGKAVYLNIDLESESE